MNQKLILLFKNSKEKISLLSKNLNLFSFASNDFWDQNFSHFYFFKIIFMSLQIDMQKIRKVFFL